MRLLPLAFALLLILACDDATTGPTDPPPNEDDPPIDVPVPGSLPGELMTTVLTPTPIRLQPDDVPEPFHSASARNPSRIIDVPAAARVQVPEGFRIHVYADGLDAPRWLALTPDGDVLVAESRANRIRVLRDANGDGTAEVVGTFASASDGLRLPFGMAFVGTSFYVGSEHAVHRFAYVPGQTEVGGGQEIASLPAGGHWTRSLAVSSDATQLYVGVGSASNVSPEADPRATVQVMNLDGSGMTTYASGLRNPVGLAVHPASGDLYTVVNERDQLGDDLVPDYFTRIQPDDFFGWPYAYLTPTKLDPRRMNGSVSERPELAATTKTPDVLYQSHVAPLGLTFYEGTMFPTRYQDGAFAALHGSWNRSTPVGYSVVFMPFGADGRPDGSYEPFLEGFIADANRNEVWARPTGLLVLPDGSLLVTDDANGRIYRIVYE